jgi:hypothetical protein
MSYLFILCLFTILLGCAKEEEKTTSPAQTPAVGETAYGKSQAVTNYLVEINPYIKSISDNTVDTFLIWDRFWRC